MKKIWGEYDLNNPQTDITTYFFRFFGLDKKYWSLKSKINSQLDISERLGIK